MAYLVYQGYNDIFCMPAIMTNFVCQPYDDIHPMSGV